MPGIDFRELRKLVSMAEVLTLLGFEPHERSGVQLRGACPLHESSAGSRVFSVNLAKNTFQCFKRVPPCKRHTLLCQSNKTSADWER